MIELVVKLIIGILLIIIGFGLINYYYRLKQNKKEGGLSFKLRTAGIGVIIIGIGIIITSLMRN